MGAPEARFAAFDRAVRSLRALATRRPLAIVLDDLHAADPPSLLLLLLLARELARCSILVIGAYRDAELRLTPGTELVSGFVDDEMVSLLRKALAALPDEGDSALRSRLMARLAATLTPPRALTDGPEILALMRGAAEMARRIGDRHALLYSMQFAATVGLLVPEHERLAWMEETLALARLLDQPLVVLHTLPAYITALLAMGARDQAEALLPSYTELLQGSRQPVQRMRYLLVNALLLALRGDFAEADRVGSEARALIGPPASSELPWLVHRLALAQLRGQPELLVAEGPALLGYLELSPATVPHAPWMLAGLGRTSEAKALLARKVLAPTPIASANLWDLLGTAEACVLLEHAELGERVYPLFERAADRMFWNLAPGAIVGPSAGALGDLALLIGRIPEALRHYDNARAFCEKLRAPALVARWEEGRKKALAAAAREQTVEARGTVREQSLAARDSAREQNVAGGPKREPNATTTQAVAPSSARPVAGAQPDADAPLSLRREGDVWAVKPRGGSTLRLKHVKGFGYLEYLIAQPGREVHVIELAGIEHRTGDAGPLLDAQAKAAYRARLDELAAEVSEAERFGDRARVSRAEQEIDAIAEQLASAVGLGGRDRRAASDVERTRINVQRRLKDAIERIAAADPALGRYLSAAVKDGHHRRVSAVLDGGTDQEISSDLPAERCSARRNGWPALPHPTPTAVHGEPGGPLDSRGHLARPHPPLPGRRPSAGLLAGGDGPWRVRRERAAAARSGGSELRRGRAGGARRTCLGARALTGLQRADSLPYGRSARPRASAHAAARRHRSPRDRPQLRVDRQALGHDAVHEYQRGVGPRPAMRAEHGDAMGAHAAVGVCTYLDIDRSGKECAMTTTYCSLILTAALTTACASARTKPSVETNMKTRAENRGPARSTPPAGDADVVVEFWRKAGPSLWFAKDSAFDARFRERSPSRHESAARP